MCFKSVVKQFVAQEALLLRTEKYFIESDLVMFGLNKASMRRFVEKDDSNSPILEDSESILKSFDGVEFSLASTSNEGKGKLFVTSKRFIWIGSNSCVNIDVPYIILHGVSRDASVYQKPCIYCQLDVEVNEGDEEDESEEPSECYFSPESEDLLMPIFEAFSEAAALNPDEEEEENEADGLIQYGTDDFIYNEDEVMDNVQQAKLADWESKFTDPDEVDHDDTHVQKFIKTG